MKILIYLGYRDKNCQYDTIDSFGGTEQCAYNLALQLVKYNHNVIIASDKLNTNYYNNLTFTNTDLILNDKFDIIIGLEYIHMFELFSNHNCKKILWLHNDYIYPWYNGEKLNIEYILNNNKCDIVCSSNWHKQAILSKYKINNNFIIIYNALDALSFNFNIIKQPYHICYSGQPSRGLDSILNIWNRLLKINNKFQLHIACPQYALNELNDYDINRYNNIKIHGTLSKEKLHDLQMACSWFIYYTDYNETFCNTAVENAMCGNIIITKQVAALSEILYDSAIFVNNIDDILDAIKHILNNKDYMIKLQDKVKLNSKKYDWNIIINKWLNIINEN